MAFIHQLIELLTEAPGSIIYHMVTLLSIQAALGLALWQWRHNASQETDDPNSRRMVWAMSGLLFARVAIIFAILVTSDPQIAIRILPPLEQAIDAVTVSIIVWAFSPRLPSVPRLGDVVLLIVLLFTGFMYAYFAQAWIDRLNDGATITSYTLSNQAAVWIIFQLSVLLVGAILNLIGRHRQWLLHLAVIGILFAAHLAQLLTNFITIPTDSDIAFWVRLGNLFAFPLLVVVVYRHNLFQLLSDQASFRTSSHQLARHLKLTREVIDSLDINQTMHQALQMATELIQTDYLGLAVLTVNSENQLHLVSTQKTRSQTAGVKSRDDNQSQIRQQNWALNLADWPAIRLAMQQRQRVELIPNGLGARQLHDIYSELGISNLGSLLIEPLLSPDNELGVMLMAGPEGQERWPAEDKALSVVVANFLARAIHNAQQYQRALRETGGIIGGDETIVSGRLIALEEERDQALAELESAETRWKHLESQLTAETQRRQELEDALKSAQNFNRDDRVTSLEQEVETLRESLMEAEEAMALASASEAGLSPEWVMMAITRYSGEVEEAMARIQYLENQLAKQEDLQLRAKIASMVQELKTPLTSLSGYSDLLISESMGILGTNQMSLMRRVKANIGQMSTLLDQIIQLSHKNIAPVSARSQVNVNEAIETAINSVRRTVRDKSLRLDIDLADDLPLIPSNGDTFYQIVTHILNNACQVSMNDGRILISAHSDSIQEKNPDGETELFDFLHLSVTDSGNGLSQEIHSMVLETHRQTDRTVPDNVHDLGYSLSSAVNLVNAQGGRVWLSREWETGDTLSVLLPIHSNGYASANGKSHS